LILDLLDVAAEDGLVLYSRHVSLLFPEPPPLERFAMILNHKEL
jgi:hypothetical protein